MRNTIRAAALAAAGFVLSGCIPVAMIPVFQGGAAVAMSAFCSEPMREERAEIRRSLYGDEHASILGREECD